jgi:hypothetical protein
VVAEPGPELLVDVTAATVAPRPTTTADGAPVRKIGNLVAVLFERAAPTARSPVPAEAAG